MLSIPAFKQRVEHNILPPRTYDRYMVMYTHFYTTRSCRPRTNGVSKRLAKQYQYSGGESFHQ